MNRELTRLENVRAVYDEVGAFINANYGHAAGDVLRELRKKLLRAMRLDEKRLSSPLAASPEREGRQTQDGKVTASTTTTDSSYYCRWWGSR